MSVVDGAASFCAAGAQRWFSVLTVDWLVPVAKLVDAVNCCRDCDRRWVNHGLDDTSRGDIVPERCGSGGFDASLAGLDSDGTSTVDCASFTAISCSASDDLATLALGDTVNDELLSTDVMELTAVDTAVVSSPVRLLARRMSRAPRSSSTSCPQFSSNMLDECDFAINLLADQSVSVAPPGE